MVVMVEFQLEEVGSLPPPPIYTVILPQRLAAVKMAVEAGVITGAAAAAAAVWG